MGDEVRSHVQEIRITSNKIFNNGGIYPQFLQSATRLTLHDQQLRLQLRREASIMINTKLKVRFREQILHVRLNT